MSNTSFFLHWTVLDWRKCIFDYDGFCFLQLYRIQCIQYNVFNTYNVWNLISIPFALQDPIKQFMDIDVGLKMNSYTVNNLEPGVEYLFELCLRKESYIIPISSTLLTTRNSGYEVALGIETDYVTLGAVTVILTTLVISCFAISFLRWYVHVFWNIHVFGELFLHTESNTFVYLSGTLITITWCTWGPNLETVHLKEKLSCHLQNTQVLPIPIILQVSCKGINASVAGSPQSSVLPTLVMITHVDNTIRVCCR